MPAVSVLPPARVFVRFCQTSDNKRPMLRPPQPLLPTYVAPRSKRKSGAGGVPVASRWGTCVKVTTFLIILLTVVGGLFYRFGSSASRDQGDEDLDRGGQQGGIDGRVNRYRNTEDELGRAHGRTKAPVDGGVAGDLAARRTEHMQRMQQLRRRERQGEGDSIGPVQNSREERVAAEQPSRVHVNVEQKTEEKAPEDTQATTQPQSLFALQAVNIDGQPVDLSIYTGKVVLVVNVASACGYTDQNYKGLQATYLKYKERGLEILGFPCNQFGEQESGTEAAIKELCTGRYHVTFPMFSKIFVNGPTTHPVYRFLKRQLPVAEGGGGGSGPGNDIAWNFFKFLVNRQGQPVKLFHQTWDAAAIEPELERLLGPAPQQQQQQATGQVLQHQQAAETLPDSPPPPPPAVVVQEAASPVAAAVQEAEAQTQAQQAVAGGAGGTDGGLQPELQKAAQQPVDFFSLSAVDIDGRTVQMSQYKGSVIMVVNVASACGYTDQNYKGLQATYLKYREYGLQILGFPCNQFGSQEAGSEAEIKDFCTGKYHVTFPMFSKVDVNGPNAHPIYQFLKRQLPDSEGGGSGVGPGKDIGWNFFKFLVNKHGQPVKLFPQSFDGPAIEHEIYRLLHEA